MPKYIDADKFLQDNAYFADREFINPKYEDTLRDLIDGAPAADVEPVRPGRWVSKEGIYGVVYCSICDFELKINNTPRCPNCGAKMDTEPPKEEENDEQ